MRRRRERSLEPVKLLRREQVDTDRYGKPIYGEVLSDLPPARFAPGGMVEPIEQGREPVVLNPTLYWRKLWPEILPSDRLVVRGDTYTVVGEPADWKGRSVGGLVVQLLAVKDGAA